MRQVATDVYQQQWSMAHQLRTVAAAESARFVLEHVPLHLGKDHFALRQTPYSPRQTAACSWSSAFGREIG